MKLSLPTQAINLTSVFNSILFDETVKMIHT